MDNQVQLRYISCWLAKKMVSMLDFVAYLLGPGNGNCKPVEISSSTNLTNLILCLINGHFCTIPPYNCTWSVGLTASSLYLIKGLKEKWVNTKLWLIVDCYVDQQLIEKVYL